jgi:hypothetical protein
MLTRFSLRLACCPLDVNERRIECLKALRALLSARHRISVRQLSSPASHATISRPSATLATYTYVRYAYNTVLACCS